MWENNYRSRCGAVVHPGSASNQAPEVRNAELEPTYTRVRIRNFPVRILWPKRSPIAKQNIWAHQSQDHSLQLPTVFIFIAINEAGYLTQGVKVVLWAPCTLHMNWVRGTSRSPPVPLLPSQMSPQKCQRLFLIEHVRVDKADFRTLWLWYENTNTCKYRKQLTNVCLKK